MRRTKNDGGMRLFERIERRVSYSQMVYETIREKILSLQLSPGTRLSENLLADQLSISRSPVREALKALEGERLVVTIPQKGSFVTKIVPKDIIDACEMRLVIEEWALSKYENQDPEFDDDQIKRVLQQQEKAENDRQVAKYLDLDSRFHELVIAAADNTHADRMYVQTHTAIVRVRAWAIQHPAEWPKGVTEHREIYDALCIRDYRKARCLLSDQVKRLYPVVKELIQAHPEFCGEDPA